MKKLHALALPAALLFAAPAAAQSPMSLVLGGGATMAYATDEEATEGRLGYNASAGLVFGLTDLLGVRAEAAWVQKGAGATIEEAGASGSLDIELEYLVVRGLIEIGGDFHILAGGSAGINRQCNVAISVTVQGTDMSLDRTCEEEMLDPNTDIGVTAGAGYHFGPFGVTALFTEGLTDIFGADAAPEGKNRTFSVMGTLRLPLG